MGYFICELKNVFRLSGAIKVYKRAIRGYKGGILKAFESILEGF